MSRAVDTRPALRVLLLSTLFPNACQPRTAQFVEQRLLKLLTAGEIETRVVAPVPWFPFAMNAFGRYGEFARIPLREQRGPLSIVHPRYLVIPKVGMGIAPELLARGVRSTLRRLIADGFDFDVIDAHFYYPDGVAAAILSCELGKPLVITARGSDINEYTRWSGPRRRILWAAEKADANVAVSEALARRMIEIGMDRTRVHVLRNGVDLDVFAPHERAATRASLGWQGAIALSVGNLIELKGHHLAIEAMQRLPNWSLKVIGTGPMERQLRTLASRHGVLDRVEFIGGVPHASMPRYFAAADVLILASSREGMPNVVLESLACGTPVVATNVGGIAEVVTESAAGELIETRSASAIAAGVIRVAARQTPRESVRAIAQRFGWEEISSRQNALLREAVDRHARSPR